MKKISLALALMFSLSAQAAPTLKKLWSVENAGAEETLKNPESALFVPGATVAEDFIAVSNVAGGAAEKDGVGWISKLSTDGKVLDARWVTGLNAPKGLAHSTDAIWVADIDELVRIDIKTKELQKFPIAGAKFLNDVVFDGKQHVLVSDMLDAKIHSFDIKTNKSIVFMSTGPWAPNGLQVVDDRLYVAEWGTKINANDFSVESKGVIHRVSGKLSATVHGARIKLALEDLKLPVQGNLDGLEYSAQTGWWVSDWSAGKVYQTSSKSKKAPLLLDKQQASADLGYFVSKTHGEVLLVPEMNSNALTAYAISGR